MKSLAENTAPDPLDGHLETFLPLAQQGIAQANLTRIRYFRFAHNHGWPYERIGRAVGLTGGAVRQLLNRNPEEQ